MKSFQTHYTREFHKGETNSGELIVETAGYIPPKKQIEGFMLAGVRLREARAEQYDFKPGEPDNGFNDPTRNVGYDLADASQDLMNIKPMEPGTGSAAATPEVEKSPEGEEKEGV